METATNKVHWHILGSSVVVNYDGTVKSVGKKTKKGREVINCIKQGRLDDIPSIIDPYYAINKDSSTTGFEVKDGMVYSNGEVVHKIISKKIIEFMDEGIPFDYLLKFWNNLKNNPSENSKNQLFEFLEANQFPITSDGCFIAYKKVRDDYMDDWSGKMDNSVGKIVEMPREEVVDDPTQSCSAGLHIAPYEYAQVYKSNGKMIQLKVNPADVVSVPVSYAHQKSRVCKYEVISDVTETGKHKDSLVISDGALKGYDEFAIVDGELVLNDNVTDETMIVDGTMVTDEQEIKSVEVDETAKNVVSLSSESDDVQLDSTGSNLPLGIDIEAEEATLIESDDEGEVVDDKPVAFMKLGNYKYKVFILPKEDVEVVEGEFKNRKKSRWAKSFVELWGKDIVKVSRAINPHTSRHEYIVELKNGSYMYVVDNDTKL
jgi:hypothetical protein